VALVVPESPVARVAPVAPEDPVVVEPEHDRVVALELALAVAELERVPPAVPLKNKSATELHHRDRVPVRRAEDLAAAAETTREPAATEAGKAWAAAVTAGAVVLQ
jgi:hypothetical protein